MFRSLHPHLYTKIPIPLLKRTKERFVLLTRLLSSANVCALLVQKMEIKWGTKNTRKEKKLMIAIKPSGRREQQQQQKEVCSWHFIAMKERENERELRICNMPSKNHNNEEHNFLWYYKAHYRIFLLQWFSLAQFFSLLIFFASPSVAGVLWDARN
jgi:hypothetical protein